MAKNDARQIVSQQSQLRFRMPRLCGRVDHNEPSNDPNKWFADKFPEQAAQYGSAFLEGTWTDTDGLKRFIPAYLNEDLFAALLQGDKRLGHHVVYFPPEETFYFFDYRLDAYCPTTEAKLKLLISNYLVRCSQECGALVDVTNLVVKFREDDVLERIIVKARAVLEADRLFFQGKEGQRRYVDGRYIEPNEEPSYQLFVDCQHVGRSFGESGGWWKGVKSGVRAVEIIVEEKVRKVSGAMRTGLIRPGISPFAGDGLDETFSFSIGLGPVGFGEEMFDAKLVAGGGKVVGAIRGAAVGEHALNDNSVSFVELDCLMKRGNNTSDLFIREQTGKSQARVIINGDVEIFDSSAALAQRAVTSSAHARPLKTAQLLDIEVKEFALRYQMCGAIPTRSVNALVRGVLVDVNERKQRTQSR